MGEKMVPLSFREGLRIWGEIREEVPGEHHLSQETLEMLAEHGRLEHEDEAHIEHLAGCPKCLRKWKMECQNVDLQTSGTVADDWYSGGILEAASSGYTGRPVSLPSKCGNFLLRLLPEKGRATRCMVILEVVGSLKTKFENCLVQIHDRQGTHLLEGLVTGGRVARMVDSIEEFDMETWSMVVKFTNISGKD